MNEVLKSFAGEPRKADVKRDLSQINRYALKEMSPEELFVFSCNLCDDQVDRDLEAFSVRSLKKLATLFLGKPLIQDHAWSASNQQGRIYAAQVVQDGGISRLRASIYMVRTPSTEETIKQIEGGILREVSIGCRMKRRACSVCGADMSVNYMDYKVKCKNGHIRGEAINGQIVHTVLEDPEDAYEVSLVPVPAQRQAGITKAVGRKQEIDPEEAAKRKEILEKSQGVKISDEVWSHVLAGEVPVAVVVTAAKAAQAKADEPLPDQPLENDHPGSVKYAILPPGTVDQEVYAACMTALAHVRKELGLPKLSIKYFVPLEDLYEYHLHDDVVKTFEHIPSILGTVDKVATDRIYVRVVPNKFTMQRTVMHEYLHIWQLTKSSVTTTETMEKAAYRYTAESFARLCAMSKQECEALLLSEL